MLDLVYHKSNPLFTTVVDGNIFLKIGKTITWEKTLQEDIIFTQLLQWWNYNTKTPLLYGWKAFWIILHQKWLC